MSTRSTIAIELLDGTVQQIYCHFDGYPSYNGQLLQKYWKDTVKVVNMISLGDMSSLGKEIGDKHPFDNPYKFGTNEYKDHRNKYENWCRFYGRDRGEKVRIDRYDNINQYLADFDSKQEYNYILRYINNEWNWYAFALGEKLMPLETMLESECDI